MGIYEELQARGLIAQVTNEPEIREMVNNGKATFYIGFDPTADSLHVGHFMALCLMKRLQMAGNRPVVLVGGGTGYIGDPSGRSDMRSMMTPETIQHNCDCFKKQMERFIDFGEGKAIMVNNADWLLKLNYIELLREVGACFSVNNMLRAECYKQRMEKGLSFLEFNYMIMQSYDFYYLFQHYGCNMQFGGDDQWSNMLGGTELIRRKLGKDAHAMTITLLMNSEGKKMGKTASGAVWLDPNKTSPYDFYQYWRNVGDADVLKCIRMLTFLPLEQIDEMDTWQGSQLNTAKEILAFELTKLVRPGVVVDLTDAPCCEDFGIYTPEMIEERVEVREGDILIINTGYHKYGWDSPEADEQRYMVRHPGPSLSFVKWCQDKKIAWIGVDCGSADHPMNTKIRDWCPMDAAKCDKYMQEKYGKTLQEMYPWPEQYQAMHIQLFCQPYECIHAECLGGDIDQLSNKRCVIGCFPWRLVGGESCISRIVAFTGFEDA